MSIELHPERGVNPRVSICRQCGESVGVILLGKQNHKYTCPKCNCVHYGLPDVNYEGRACRACGKCGESFGNHWKKEQIEDHECLPAELCDSCREKNEACKKVVEEGGVYWRCKDCGSAGAIKAEAELAKEVRKTSGIEAPEPVGFEFDDTCCPACGPDPVVEEEGDDAE